MSIVATGFNHKDAPLDILGRLVISDESLQFALKELHGLATVKSAVILSTCNRCEVYAEVNKLSSADEISQWLVDHAKISASIFDEYGFSYQDEKAVIHLMRVASSIDSMIVGEPQILGQVKAAYQRAAKLNYVNNTLIRLFEKTFAIAKQTRTQTDLGKYPVSYASAVLELTKRIFSNLSDKQILFIGSGEMITLTAEYFYHCGVKKLTISSRSLEKAQCLAEQFDGDAIEFTQIQNHLPDYDIVVSCTASDKAILSKNDIQQALKERRHRPVCIADLALPCDIESSVDTLEDVYLYPLEKLANIIDENQAARLKSAQQVEIMVEAKAKEYFIWDNSQKINSTVSLLRETADELRDKTLRKAIEMIESGKPVDQALSYLSTTLTNRLLHIPTTILKYTAEDGCFELIKKIETLLKQNNQDKQ